MNLSGGAPLFIMRLCLQLRKDVSCSFISSSISCRMKLSYAKIYFLLPARNFKAHSGLAMLAPLKIENYIGAIWIVNRNHKISKCMTEFHPEERATHVVIQ